MFIGQLFKHWTYQVFAPGSLLRDKYAAFRSLLEHDDASLARIADLEEIHYGDRVVDWAMVKRLCEELSLSVERCVRDLQRMSPTRYMTLLEYFHKIDFYVKLGLDLPEPALSPPYTVALDDCPSDAPFPESLVGGKAHGLIRAGAAGCPTPPGFVITTNAYEYFLEVANLRDPIREKLSRVELGDPETVRDAAETLYRLVRDADLPEVVQEELGGRLDRLALQAEASGLLRPPDAHDRPDAPLRRRMRVAARSSAVGEDGAKSFAGQFDTLLHIVPDDLACGYKEVIASRYTVSAITYRVRAGLADEETPMAVLVMPMVNAHASGVALSRDTARTRAHSVGVYVVEGTGDALVDGSQTGQTFHVDRDAEDALALAPMRSQPPLLRTGEAVREIARYAVRLEHAERDAQTDQAHAVREMEWAEDAQGRIWVLQSRPYIDAPHATGSVPDKAAEPASSTRQAPPPLPPLPEDVAPLLQDLAVAAPGAAVGLVHHMRAAELTAAGMLTPSALEPLARFTPPETAADQAPACAPPSPGTTTPSIPEGVVLVAPSLAPSLAGQAHRLAGVVAAAGSRASHFASIARELGLPVFVSPEADPFAALPHGEPVTLALSPTSRRGVALPGARPELVPERATAPPLQNTPVGERLAAIIPRVAPLRLTSPEAPEFAPEGCRSFHDLVRFVHEKSVSEMFSLVDKGGRAMTRAKKLETTLPLTLYVLDLGDGLFPHARQHAVIKPEDINSAPLWALWWGLADEEAVWSESLHHADWEAMDRVSAGVFMEGIKDAKSLASYAVISANYLHMMIRFGYHFSVLDCVCGPEAKNNYINFRFQGGGAAFEQRLRRITLIERALSHFGFAITRRGDLLEANLAREGEQVIQRRLAMLGYLMAMTRMLDMQLTDDEAAERAYQAFLAKTDR